MKRILALVLIAMLAFAGCALAEATAIYGLLVGLMIVIRAL